MGSRRAHRKWMCDHRGHCDGLSDTQPTYMAYIVFLISKDEKNATVTSGLGGLAAVTFAILLVLGLELFDTAEPALRFPFMAMASFAAMFSARTFARAPLLPGWLCHRIAAVAGR